MANTNRTFLELQAAVQTEMQLDPGLISVDERKAFLNQCLNDLGSIGLFEKSATLTVVNGSAALPDDFVDVVAVKYSGNLLMPMEHMSTSTGLTPVGYILQYGTLETFPTVASCTLSLQYAYSPAPMVEATDKPDIPNGYDKLLVDWAVGHAHRKNGNIGLYREYLNAYGEGKYRLTLELTKRFNSRVTNPFNKEYSSLPSTPFDFLL